jgi:hypothetical protein
VLPKTQSPLPGGFGTRALHEEQTFFLLRATQAANPRKRAGQSNMLSENTMDRTILRGKTNDKQLISNLFFKTKKLKTQKTNEL